MPGDLGHLPAGALQRQERLVLGDDHLLPVRAGVDLDQDPRRALLVGLHRVHGRLHRGEVAAALLVHHDDRAAGARGRGGRRGTGRQQRRLVARHVGAHPRGVARQPRRVAAVPVVPDAWRVVPVGGGGGGGCRGGGGDAQEKEEEQRELVLGSHHRG